jgi:hypothetical protein
MTASTMQSAHKIPMSSDASFGSWWMSLRKSAGSGGQRGKLRYLQWLRVEKVGYKAHPLRQYRQLGSSLSGRMSRCNKRRARRNDSQCPRASLSLAVIIIGDGRFSALGAAHAHKVGLPEDAKRLPCLDQLLSLPVLAALAVPHESDNVLIAND